jgi:AcrR family transcriptional regulator
VSEHVDGRHAIAERNAEAILDAALRVLRADPHAGMAEIAADAGVGRATLYRHHPTRDSLVEALRDRLRVRAQQVMQEAQLDEGDPLHALERFVAALWELRDVYAVIAPPDSPAKERRAEEFWRSMIGLVERLQAAGAVDPELPATWALSVLQGVLRATVAEVEAGRLRRDRGIELSTRAFLSGVGPRGR